MSWEEKRLGDVVTVKKRINSGSPLPYVGMEHISSGTGEFLGELDPVAVKSSTFYFEPGQLLYGRLRPYLNKVLLPEFKGHCSTEVFPIQPSSAIDKRFLFYWFTSDSTVSRIDATCTGARMPRADVHEVLDFEIPVPPLPEQQRIVGKLDAAFAALAEAQAHVERNRANARELFDSTLETAMNDQGSRWRTTLLGEVCELYQGVCINAKTKHLLVEHSGLPLLRIKDLRENTTVQYIAETGWPKNARVEETDLIYTRTGQIGLVFRGRSGVLHNNSFKVEPTASLDRSYLFWWLQAPSFRRRILSLTSKAAQPDITHKLFKAQSIAIPPFAHQQEMVARIESTRKLTEQLETTYQQKLSELAGLKKAVLGAAFRGEL